MSSKLWLPFPWRALHRRRADSDSPFTRCTSQLTRKCEPKYLTHTRPPRNPAKDSPEKSAPKRLRNPAQLGSKSPSQDSVNYPFLPPKIIGRSNLLASLPFFATLPRTPLSQCSSRSRTSTRLAQPLTSITPLSLSTQSFFCT